MFKKDDRLVTAAIRHADAVRSVKNHRCEFMKLQHAAREYRALHLDRAEKALIDARTELDAATMAEGAPLAVAS